MGGRRGACVSRRRDGRGLGYGVGRCVGKSGSGRRVLFSGRFSTFRVFCAVFAATVVPFLSPEQESRMPGACRFVRDEVFRRVDAFGAENRATRLISAPIIGGNDEISDGTVRESRWEAQGDLRRAYACPRESGLVAREEEEPAGVDFRLGEGTAGQSVAVLPNGDHAVVAAGVQTVA